MSWFTSAGTTRLPAAPSLKPPTPCVAGNASCSPQTARQVNAMVGPPSNLCGFVDPRPHLLLRHCACDALYARMLLSGGRVDPTKYFERCPCGLKWLATRLRRVGTPSCASSRGTIYYLFRVS